MNKKLVSIIGATLVAGTLLVGCGSSTAKGPQDGSYKAEFSEADDHGWVGFVEIKVADGKITEAKSDYVNAEGKLKSEDKEYEENMKKASDSYPAKFSKEFSTALVEKGNVDEIDNISGATTSSNDFKLLAKEALNAANKGNTDTIKVKPSK
ncbi:FMN-binding protein [Clostridium senegalense]|uniref:FMN-binding protein n=1 Tax=Clostridium senegalense TaxID=1465809 RepID=UPI001C11A78E|nr:FMN-binding protein [Clostridium senegalense]MBU5225830.1 FMN-binding protein [Clostridium senegalense]